MNKHAPNPALEKWLDGITPSMRKMLSRMAGTSESMYRQWFKGRRRMSAEKAGDLEEAMSFLHKHHPNVPEPLSRGDLCDACRKCPYFSNSSGKELSVDDML